MSLGAETPFVILLFSAIVAVDIFPLEAFTIQIKHCQVQPSFDLVTERAVSFSLCGSQFLIYKLSHLGHGK